MSISMGFSLYLSEKDWASHPPSRKGLAEAWRPAKFSLISMMMLRNDESGNKGTR